MRTLQAAAEVAAPWGLNSEAFLAAAVDMRLVEVAALQREVETEVILLKVVSQRFAGGRMGRTTRSNLVKVVGGQKRNVRSLLSRLLLWQRGGFLALPPLSACPGGGGGEGGIAGGGGEGGGGKGGGGGSGEGGGEGGG